MYGYKDNFKKTVQCSTYVEGEHCTINQINGTCVYTDPNDDNGDLCCKTVANNVCPA
uniref:Uncharacterized protein n=1 Tax=viral metagenome TaxID=1070528 RepID=A0A6C0I209_9ZZZZ